MENFIYLISEKKYLQNISVLNLEIIELKKILSKIEINFATEINEILETKPNFEQHLKEKMDCIYQAQDFLNNIENENISAEIKMLFLNSYIILENHLEKKFKQNYEKAFKSMSRKFFFNLSKNKTFTEINNDINFLSNFNNPERESFFNKEKLNKIFLDFNSYKFFLKLKKLLCTENANLLAEYSYIYRKMIERKLINQSVSESYFRFNFLELYCDDLNLDKLKTLTNLETKHRNIIYDLAWEQNRTYLS